MNGMGLEDLLKARRRRRLGLIVAASVALLAHGLVAAGVGILSDQQKEALSRKLKLDFKINKPKPKPKPKPKAKPKPKPKPKKRRKIDFTKRRRPKPLKTPVEPPQEPPPPVFGVSLSSTSATGTGITVSVGNSLQVDPEKSARTAAKAFKPTPSHELTTRPRIGRKTMARLQALPYPPKALDLDLEGRVILQLDINEKGKVIRVKVLQDPGADLGATAKRMFKSIRFIPATVNGEPVAARLRFKYDFVIEF